MIKKNTKRELFIVKEVRGVLKKKEHAVIIASRGHNTSILCDGKLYWSNPITEINFHHRAGEIASISITCDSLPVLPDEDKRLKDDFKKWVDILMGESLTEGCTPVRIKTHHKTE